MSGNPSKLQSRSKSIRQTYRPCTVWINLTTDSVMFRTPYTTDESLDGSPGVKLKNMQDEQWGPIQVLYFRLVL